MGSIVLVRGMGAISNVVTSEAFNDGIIMKQSCEGGKDMKEYMSLQGKISKSLNCRMALRQFS